MLFTLFLIARNKRGFIYIPFQRTVQRLHDIRRHCIIRRIRCRFKGRDAPAFPCQPLNIQLPIDRFIQKTAGFLQQTSVFADQMMPAEYQIRRRLPLPGAGIDITARQPSGLDPDQIPSVRLLARDLITGRQIYNHSCPMQRMAHSGRLRRPYILADLRRRQKSRHISAGKENIGSKGHLKTLPVNKCIFLRRFCKITRLVKFTVIRNAGLGNQTQKPAVREACRHVIELSFHLQRNPHKEQPVHPFTGFDHCKKRFFCLS